MTAADAIEIIKLLTDHGIVVHVDGGWGVDALLGKQTRPHSDLDIAIQHEDVPKLRQLLDAFGFRDIPRDDTRDCNFVLADEQGRQVDVHSYTFDANGNNTFGVEYPADSLTGIGRIDGYSVNCIDPEWMVRFHSGYTLGANDHHDVSALCDRFGIELPTEYHKSQSDRQ